MPAFVNEAVTRLMPALTGLLVALVTASVASAQTPPAPAVGVIQVQMQDVTPSDRFVGRAEAIDRVELRARVQGFLDERLFQEGGRVSEGDLLFVIEKAPYEAILAQRQAELSSAEAEVENAATQLARGELLLQDNNIPAAEVDERRARLLIAQAAVLEARAAIQSAELDLGYTDITAPISGRIGRSVYSVGALVGPDSGTLATIVSDDPIHVVFPVSQAVLTRHRQAAIDTGAEPEIVFHVELPTGERYGETGSLAFAEVEVDAGTDTLSIRARFANPDRLLTPGQFLTVIIEESDPREAIVIPAAALLVDQAGPYVLVVGAGETVEQRRVTLGEGEDGTAAIVADGLEVGERVIVDGIQKVRPGQEVTASPVAPTAGGPAGPAARS